MKTLVIHPSDPSTDFLKVVYQDSDWTVINSNTIGKRALFDQIKNHQRIIMMGHGSKAGLFGKNRMIIDSTWVYLLRSKKCICIWCNADEFVEKYQLGGFCTGMIISDYVEADYFSVKATLEEIDQSNHLFALAVKTAIDHETPDLIAKEIYNLNTHIVNFNKLNIHLKQ